MECRDGSRETRRAVAIISPSCRIMKDFLSKKRDFAKAAFSTRGQFILVANMRPLPAKGSAFRSTSLKKGNVLNKRQRERERGEERERERE